MPELTSESAHPARSDGTAPAPSPATPSEPGTTAAGAAEPSTGAEGDAAEPRDRAPRTPDPAGRDRVGGLRLGAVPRRTLLLAAGMSVLLLALWVAGGALFLRNQDLGRADSDRAAALAAAAKMATDITSISSDDAQVRVQALSNESTGPFHQQLTQYASALQMVLSQARVGSQGSVTAAGIEDITGDEATALVTVGATVSGGVLAGPQPISYRLAVRLHRDSGRWLTSDLKFVQ